MIFSFKVFEDLEKMAIILACFFFFSYEIFEHVACVPQAFTLEKPQCFDLASSFYCFVIWSLNFLVVQPVISMFELL